MSTSTTLFPADPEQEGKILNDADNVCVKFLYSVEIKKKGKKKITKYLDFHNLGSTVIAA